MSEQSNQKQSDCSQGECFEFVGDFVCLIITKPGFGLDGYQSTEVNLSFLLFYNQL
jgi:hypothetical protein